MRDSGWWHPFAVGLPMIGCMFVRWLIENIPTGSWLFFIKLGGLFTMLFVLWIVVTINNDRKASKWQKPVAIVLDKETIQVRGNVETLQGCGIPGVIDWEHVGHKIWRIKINTVGIGTYEVQGVADLINNWNGKTQ